MDTPDVRLLFASNRGPVSFRSEYGEIVPRAGAGGLVTGLRDVAVRSHAVWISSAMTAEDEAISREHGFGSFAYQIDGDSFRLRLVPSEREVYSRFYDGFANSVLWPLQHYLFDLGRLADTSIWEEDFRDYREINGGIADAVVDELERSGPDEALVMIQDYHLYGVARAIRARRPDAFCSQFVHIPWTQPDSWRVLPRAIRDAVFGGLLANDVVGFHSERWAANFFACCTELLGLEVDERDGAVVQGNRRTWVRVRPLPISPEYWARVAASEESQRLAAELRERRRTRRLILRVDRPDPSKNVLRALDAFDRLLAEHPEHRGEVVLIQHLEPSRSTVPGYPEHLAEIRARVAAINAAHGQAGWEPIELIHEQSVERAAAEFRNFDVLFVNPVLDGRNLVALDGSLLNEVDGVLVLSENAGAHELLGPHAMTVNPFDVTEQAKGLHAALKMERWARAEHARARQRAVATEQPWFDGQLEDYLELRRRR